MGSQEIKKQKRELTIKILISGNGEEQVRHK